MPFHGAQPAKIASGETVGVTVDLRGQRVVGIQTPATLTGTTLTWQVAPTATGTFDAAYHLSTLAATATVVTSVAASRHISLPFDKAPANCFLKLVSGSAEGADRTFYLYTEPC
jgi:hypothetical protein